MLVFLAWINFPTGFSGSIDLSDAHESEDFTTRGSRQTSASPGGTARKKTSRDRPSFCEAGPAIGGRCCHREGRGGKGECCGSDG